MDLARISAGLKDDQSKDAGERSAKRDLTQDAFFFFLKIKTKMIPWLLYPILQTVSERGRMGDGSLLTI